MGLIREIQNIEYSLNKTTRLRLERENRRIELENYNRILHEELQERFREYHKNDIPEIAYNNIIKNYYAIINDIMTYVNSLTGKIDGKEYFIYKNRYSIQQDLENYFFQDLNKIKKIYDKKYNEYWKTLETTLENAFKSYFIKYDDKLAVAKVLGEYDTIGLILDEITNNAIEREYLVNNYYKVYNKILKQYKYTIQRQKEDRQIEKHNKRAKQKRVLFNLYLCNQILGGIAKGFEKSSKYLK